MAFVIGCGDTGSMTTNAADNSTRYERPDDLNEGSELRHVEPHCTPGQITCSRTMSIGDTITLRVQLLNSDGDAIPQALVAFDLTRINGGEGAALDSLQAFTDSNGIAEVPLNSRDDNPGANMGSLEIRASIEDIDGVEDLIFNVGISTKDGASYIIRYTHDGQATPNRVRTRVLDSNITCNEAIADFFATGSWPQAIVNLSPVPVYPNGDISDAIYPQVSNNESYTIVGIAIEDVGSETVDVAYGCSDNNEAVTMGQDVIVEIALGDHIPHIAQSYGVTHHFNITDALPPAVQSIISLIETLSNNPAAFILGCPAENTAVCCPSGPTQQNAAGNTVCTDGGHYGLFDIMLDLGVLGSSIEGYIDTFREGVMLGWAMDLLNGMLFGDPDDPNDTGILPSWVHNTVVGAGDIAGMLQAFNVNGRMFFDEQPTLGTEGGQVVGFLAEENNRQYWDSLVFTWNYGCAGQGPACSQIPISASDVGSGSSNIIEGSFEAKVLGATAMEIRQHSMTLHYGALLLAVIEQIVLPSIFGPTITSLEDILADTSQGGLGLLPCDTIAEFAGNPGSNIYNAVHGACGQLRQQATDSLRNYIEETLVADGDDHFQIGTPEGEPCSIYQPTNYVGSSWPGSPLPFIEQLGRSDESLRCKWDTRIRFSQNSPGVTVGGNFYGEFLQ